MDLKHNCYFFARHWNLPELRQKIAKGDGDFIPVHKRRIVFDDVDHEALVYRPNGDLMYKSEVYESGHEGYIILKRDDLAGDGEYMAYVMLDSYTDKVAPSEDIWI